MSTGTSPRTCDLGTVDTNCKTYADRVLNTDPEVCTSCDDTYTLDSTTLTCT